VFTEAGMKSITGAILMLAAITAFSHGSSFEEAGGILIVISLLYFITDWIHGLRKLTTGDRPIARLFGLDK
jgi:hypothetical protein